MNYQKKQFIKQNISTIPGKNNFYFQTYEDNSSIKIKTICENLIKYNVIDNKGKLDSKQIENEELNQIFFLEIDEEFKSINTSKKKLIESSDKILDFDNKEKDEYLKYLKNKSPSFDERNITERKKDVSKEITKTVFKNVQSIVKELMAILVGTLGKKVQEYMEKR